jgi:hypothetical protein
MTEERYDAYLKYLASSSPEIWRDTDGTLYLSWIPIEMYPTGEAADTYIRISPGDTHYGRYLDDLIAHFDYAGLEVPHAAGADRDAESG